MGMCFSSDSVDTPRSVSYRDEEPSVGPDIDSLYEQQKNLPPLLDHALGMVVGAAIGDSIGSFCEFERIVPDNIAKMAMEMPGGGTWGSRVRTGQVTDDTELALALARGLLSQQPIEDGTKIVHDFSLQPIAEEYANWFHSPPFDIGGATNNALSHAPNPVTMIRASKRFNDSSRSKGGNRANGSMMRMTPLIAYGYKLPPNELTKIVQMDSSLSHANRAVYCANTAYAIACQNMLQAAERSTKKPSRRVLRRKGIEAAQRWMNESCREFGLEGPEVQGWLTDAIKAESEEELQSAKRLIGYVKIGFQRAFFHLKHEHDFATAIYRTIGEGGDTDTNGAIVGGLVGAAVGLSGINPDYVKNICECVPGNPIRDDHWQAKHFLFDNIVQDLLDHAPDHVRTP